MKGILFFILSFLISAATLPMFIYAVRKLKLVDEPDHRKIHTTATPTLGGLSFSTAFIISFFVLNEFCRENLFYLLASLLMLITGIYDDIKNMSPKFKLLMQIIASLIVIIGMNARLSIISGDGTLINIISLAVTLIWIVGITNAVNLIDGMDGLAGGLAFMSLGALAFIFFHKGQTYYFYTCLVLMGGILGFLRYNIPPAYIFMGDTGSLFLGFQIAVLSILASYKTGTMLSTLIPFLFISLPVFDTFLAITRRLSRGQHPFKPDREHLHHRLLDLHFTDRQALIIFYAVSFAVSAVAMFFYDKKSILFAIILTFLVVYVFLTAIKIFKLFNFNNYIKRFNDYTQHTIFFSNKHDIYTVRLSDIFFMIITAVLFMRLAYLKNLWSHQDIIIMVLSMILLVVSTTWRKIFKIKNEFMGFLLFWVFFYLCRNLMALNDNSLHILALITAIVFTASLLRRKRFDALIINPTEIIVLFCLLLIYKVESPEIISFFTLSVYTTIFYLSNKIFIGSNFTSFKSYFAIITIFICLLPINFYKNFINETNGVAEECYATMQCFDKKIREALINNNLSEAQLLLNQAEHLSPALSGRSLLEKATAEYNFALFKNKIAEKKIKDGAALIFDMGRVHPESVELFINKVDAEPSIYGIEEIDVQIEHQLRKLQALFIQQQFISDANIIKRIIDKKYLK